MKSANRDRLHRSWLAFCRLGLCMQFKCNAIIQNVNITPPRYIQVKLGLGKKTGKAVSGGNDLNFPVFFL